MLKYLFNSKGRIRILWGLPEHVVVADGDGWKLQTMFVFHAEVNVFRMRQKILELLGDKESEQRAKSAN